MTRSCRHLTQVLDEFAETLCFNRGGARSVQVAIESEVVATCEYSSGLQVSGRFDRLLTNVLGREIYVGTAGPTQLAYRDRELPGHGIDYHAAGFGSPVGRLCNLMKPLEEASEYELQAMDIRRHERVRLEFLSGIRVDGVLESVIKEDHRILLMSFSDCTVTGPEGERLFEPKWGQYDMAVGEHITSVYPGSADRSEFDVYPPASGRPTRRVEWTSQDEREFALYRKLRELRESHRPGEQDLAGLLARVKAEAPNAWLLWLELLELAPPATPLAAELRRGLERLAQTGEETRLLIERGIKLLDNQTLAA